MDNRQQRVLIETDRHRITGSITMPTGGFRSRLSDFLNHAEKEFIALTEIEADSQRAGLGRLVRRDAGEHLAARLECQGTPRRSLRTAR